MTHMLKQNKGTCIDSEIGKDVPTQSDRSSTGYKDSLSLVKEGSRPNTHSYMNEWESKGCVREIAFPNSSTFRVTLLKNSIIFIVSINVLSFLFQLQYKCVSVSRIFL